MNNRGKRKIGVEGMRKKTLSALLIAVSVMLLTGCGNTVELTDEQNSMVAQYAAELLLKYDVRYDYRLEDMNSITGELQVDKVSKPAVEDTEDDSTEDETTQNEPEDSKDTEIEGSEDDKKQETELSGLFEEGIEVRCNGYKIISRYPEDISDIVAYVEPRDGMQLLVVNFSLTNTTQESMMLDYMKGEREYRIILNDAKVAAPIQTFMEEDLAMLMTTLEPGETKDVILIFQISESLVDDIQSLKVSVQQGEAKNIIILEE